LSRIILINIRFPTLPNFSSTDHGIGIQKKRQEKSGKIFNLQFHASHNALILLTLRHPQWTESRLGGNEAASQRLRLHRPHRKKIDHGDAGKWWIILKDWSLLDVLRKNKGGQS